MKKINSVLSVLIVTAAVLLSACGGGSSNDSWPTSGLGAMFSAPKSNKITIWSNDDEDFSACIDKAKSDQYDKYLAECIDQGFTIDADKETSSYEAYNSEGYRVKIHTISDSLYVDVYAPMKMTTLRWPNSEVAKLIPKPQSTVGKMEWENEDSFLLYVGETSLEQYEKYVDQCAETGFTVGYSRGDKYYYADNADGFHVSLNYEGFNTMRIQMSSPDEDETTTPEGKTTEEVTEAPTEAPSQGDGNSGVDDNVIRDDIKAAIDSYEAFIDEYCAFLENYDSSDTGMLMQYLDMVNKELEMSEQFDALENQQLTTAEDLYYSEVSLRCAQKLLSAMSKMK